VRSAEKQGSIRNLSTNDTVLNAITFLNVEPNGVIEDAINVYDKDDTFCGSQFYVAYRYSDSRRVQTPHIFLFKRILENNLRNQIVALIFAANRFLIKSNGMRRDIFQAIADPTRRAIITLIAVQAMTPNAIADNFHTTRQSVSKHLRILTECELVKQEQKGREIYYSLEIEKMKEVDKWIDQFRKIWETKFNQLDKLLSTIKKQKK
jgi:DNA-binding transcriptional ArsR family regulator